MTREQVLELCRRFPGALEDYPFGDGLAVFKVAGRMFALVSLDGDPGSVNLKCDPGLALELRAVYAAVRPGYHQNKRHWNTVELDGSIDDDELREMIDHSYDLVVNGYHAHSRAASLAADPRSVLGSGALRSCQQPGLAPPLARGDYVEIGERDGELAGAPMSQRCCVTASSSC